MEIKGFNDAKSESLFLFYEEKGSERIFYRISLDGLCNQLGVEFMSAKDVEDTDGLAAQGEGVLRTGRNEAAAEHARNGIEFIGNTQDLAHVGLRQDVAGKTRLVLFVNGFGNAFIFAVDEGIFLAHDALEFRKFHDHLRSQVGFRQERSAL